MRSRQGLLVAAASALFVLIGVSPSLAQLPRLPSGVRELPGRIPDLDRFLEPGAVLTSAIADAVGRMGPLPDGLVQGRFESLTVLPRGPRGEFMLRPGRFSTVVQSFCLKAGASAATHGDGFQAAPLAGPWASIIEGVLRNAGRVPGVAQEDVQVLLWALLARTKVSALPRRLQTLAAALMSPQDLIKVNGGALGLVPQRVLDRAQEQLPEGVREIFAAESRIRQMLADGISTYEQFEAVAVPDAGEARGRTAEIGADQWIATAQGFFVRFLPTSYHQVRIEIIVPPSAMNADRVEPRRGPMVDGPSWTPEALQAADAPIALDLPSILAMPAHTAGQRLGLSSNPVANAEPTAEDDWLTTQAPIVALESGRQPVAAPGPPASIERITPAPRVENPAAAPGAAGTPVPPASILIPPNVPVRDVPLPPAAAAPPPAPAPPPAGIKSLDGPLPPVVIDVQERVSVRDAFAPPLPPIVIDLHERVSLRDELAPPLQPVVINVLERLSVRDAVVPPLPPIVIKIDERVRVGDLTTARR